jgi:hypothetical protein
MNQNLKVISSKPDAKGPQDYKWVIVFETTSHKFAVTGYVRSRGKWSQDGDTRHFDTIFDALTLIANTEHETSRS